MIGVPPPHDPQCPCFGCAARAGRVLPREAQWARPITGACLSCGALRSAHSLTCPDLLATLVEPTRCN